MSDTSLVFSVSGRDRGVNATLSRTAGTIRGAQVAAAAGTVAATAALASAAAHAVAFTTAATASAGAVALVPAAAAAIGATVAAGAVGFAGLSAAWDAASQPAAAGASAGGRQLEQARRDVRDARQALVDARRDLADAEQAIPLAHVQETARLADLGRALTRVGLDVEAAQLAVEQAADALAKARTTPDQERAGLALRQAQQTLADTVDRQDDLTREEATARRAGVEGSAAVRDAVQRRAEAQRAVTAAEERLADTMDAVADASHGAATGGVNPAALALARLAANARAALVTARSLLPAWRAAQRAGQQATFAGVAGNLRTLSAVYLVNARGWLVRMGGAFNTVLRQTAGLATSRQTAADVGLLASNTAAATDRLARAVRPLLAGLMPFAAIGSTFLPGIADKVLDLAFRFEKWAVSARDTGKISDWIGAALATLRQLVRLVTDVVMSVVAIVRAGDNGGSTLDTLTRVTAAIRAWLESTQGQNAIAQTLDFARQVLTELGQAIGYGLQHTGPLDDALGAAGTTAANTSGPLSRLAGHLLPYLLAGYALTKSHPLISATLTKAVTVPLWIAEKVTGWQHNRAQKDMRNAIIANTAAVTANTTASRANTAAHLAGTAAASRSLVGLAANRVAQLAAAVAHRAAAAGKWLLTIASSASPMTLILLAVLGIVAAIVLLTGRTDGIREILTGAFTAVWNALKRFGGWVADNFPKLLHILTTPYRLAWTYLKTMWTTAGRLTKAAWEWVSRQAGALATFARNLPARLHHSATNAFNAVGDTARTTINTIIDLWNKLSLGVPAIRFAGVTLGGVRIQLPDLPRLAQGGHITHAGAAVVGDGGEPEIVTMPPGATKSSRRMRERRGLTSSPDIQVEGGEDTTLGKWFRHALNTGTVTLVNAP